MVQMWSAQHLNPTVRGGGIPLFHKPGSLLGVGAYQPTGKQVHSSIYLCSSPLRHYLTAN